MRCLKISFNTTEDKAGTMLADLVEKGVSNLDFHVVADLPTPRGGNGLTPSRQNTTGKASTIPTLFTKAFSNREQVNVQDIKRMLADSKMSPNSYTHAINVLKVADLIHTTNERGVYKVVRS